jgi:hypothetical protein
MAGTMSFMVRGCLGIVLLIAMAACPAAPAEGPRRGGGGGINPDACGKLDSSELGRKAYAFLVASAELDRASLELEGNIRNACARMATELGIPSTGDTRTLCMAVKKELDANLQVSVSTEKRLVTRTTPPVCKTDVDFTAGFVAQCEARAVADVSVTCDGRCGGTCSGACDGTCLAGTQTQCEGQCDGVCRGRCSGSCQGYADVQASAECKASAEIRATTRTTCTEAKVEVVEQDVTVIDATKFNRAMAAINAGMPTLLTTGKKLELAARALVLWVQTGASLARASGDYAAQLGERGVCVGIQLAAAVAASTAIQARFSVSIEVSAEISASAGATAN